MVAVASVVGVTGVNALLTKSRVLPRASFCRHSCLPGVPHHPGIRCHDPKVSGSEPLYWPDQSLVHVLGSKRLYPRLPKALDHKVLSQDPQIPARMHKGRKWDFGDLKNAHDCNLLRCSCVHKLQ